MSLFKSFLNDESGATAIEYGLIAAIIGVGITAALTALKGSISTTFSDLGAQMTKCSDGDCSS